MSGNYQPNGGRNAPKISTTSNSSTYPMSFRNADFPDRKSVRELEETFNSILVESNIAARESNVTEENAKDKMLNYCIRMLHSEGWIPQTVIRAMALKELQPEKPIKRNMYQAFRERREEMRAEKMTRNEAGDIFQNGRQAAKLSDEGNK